MENPCRTPLSEKKTDHLGPAQASGADSHRDLHADWGSSDMHIRGCLCDECCPGTKARATRVYSAPSDGYDRGCFCARCRHWCASAHEPCRRCTRLRARKVAA